MSNKGSFFPRALGALILIGILAAGGALLFQAGQAQGYQMGAAAASQAASGEAPGAAPLVPYGPSYGPYYPQPFINFFPFGWMCGSILMVLLALFALRLVSWPRRWYYHGKRPGDWRDHPHPWGPPPWTREQPRPETGQSGVKPPDQPASETAA